VVILDLRDGVSDTVEATTSAQEQSCSANRTGSEGVAWVLKETYAASDNSSSAGS
jgi:hypothetical protein